MEFVCRLTRSICHDAIVSFPGVAQRVVVRRFLSALAEVGFGSESIAGRALAAAATVMLSAPLDVMTLHDLAEFGKKAALLSPGLAFKAREDGAGHWNVRLDFGGGVLCTVSQLDDRVDMALTAMVVALLLKYIGPKIQEEIVRLDAVPRREVEVDIMSIVEAEGQLSLDLIGLETPMRMPCVITTAADLGAESQVPIVAICRGDFGTLLAPNDDSLPASHLLLGQLVMGIVEHVLMEQVEYDAIRPKVISVMRSIVA